MVLAVLLTVSARSASSSLTAESTLAIISMTGRWQVAEGCFSRKRFSNLRCWPSLVVSKTRWKVDLTSSSTNNGTMGGTKCTNNS